MRYPLKRWDGNESFTLTIDLNHGAHGALVAVKRIHIETSEILRTVRVVQSRGDSAQWVEAKNDPVIFFSPFNRRKILPPNAVICDNDGHT